MIHEATSSDRVEQLQYIWLRFEVFKEGTLVQSQLRMHRLRWYHKYEFVMMLKSVGFREITVQCGYSKNESVDPEADMIFSAIR